MSMMDTKCTLFMDWSYCLIYIVLSNSNELLDYYNWHFKKIVHFLSVNIAV